MGKTNIEWTDETWNPVRGCRRVSPGCQNCYAERMATRLSGPGQAYAGLVDVPKRHSQTNSATTGVRGKWNGTGRFIEDQLAAPLHWRKPRRVFVNSMSDLFYEAFTDAQIAEVFAIMAACPQHTFQVLTKRAKRMYDWFSDPERPPTTGRRLWNTSAKDALGHHFGPWPLPNVWMGVSAENQECADERVRLLHQVPAAVRFISYEPALAPVKFPLRAAMAVVKSVDEPAGTAIIGDLRRVKIDWLIAGAESGPGARPMDEDWVRSVRDQCQAAGTAFFYKQNAVRGRKIPVPLLDGRQWMEYPDVAA
jgi:protein gp37